MILDQAKRYLSYFELEAASEISRTNQVVGFPGISLRVGQPRERRPSTP